MAKGKKTGGRKKGTPNRMTQAREAAVEEVREQIDAVLGPAAFDGDAHALLMAIYKDSTQSMVLRLDAAKGAIGYEKPKLSSIDASFDGTVGTYEAKPIPVEARDSDTLEGPARAPIDGDPAGHC
jgi:hypothetical protein